MLTFALACLIVAMLFICTFWLPSVTGIPAWKWLLYFGGTLGIILGVFFAFRAAGLA